MVELNAMLQRREHWSSVSSAEKRESALCSLRMAPAVLVGCCWWCARSLPCSEPPLDIAGQPVVLMIVGHNCRQCRFSEA